LSPAHARNRCVGSVTTPMYEPAPLSRLSCVRTLLRGDRGALQHSIGEMMMTTIATPSSTPELRLRQAPQARQEWEIYRAQGLDVADVKELFRKLHAFNAALDPRFALSNQWEVYFNTTMQRALCADDAICFIAREAGMGLPCGFALAAM